MRHASVPAAMAIHWQVLARRNPEPVRQGVMRLVETAHERGGFHRGRLGHQPAAALSLRCARRVLARGEGEGASVPDCAGRFAAAVAAWDKAHGMLPAVLGGMVGSTIGWKEVPYLRCPAKPQAIAGAALRFEAGGRAIAILPGLSCTGKTGAPDVMRGEETQILGALRLHPELAQRPPSVLHARHPCQMGCGGKWRGDANSRPRCRANCSSCCAVTACWRATAARSIATARR